MLFNVWGVEATIRIHKSVQLLARLVVILEFPEICIRLQISAGICADLTGEAVTIDEINQLVRIVYLTSRVESVRTSLHGKKSHLAKMLISNYSLLPLLLLLLYIRWLMLLLLLLLLFFLLLSLFFLPLILPISAAAADDVNYQQ